MRPAWLAGAAALAAYGLVRRRAHGPVVLSGIGLVAAAAATVGLGVVPLPDVEQLIEDAGTALGKWTYLFVGALAYLETGAFVGLVAPGETTVIVGGLVAGQGQISLVVLIAVVWTCAVAGDLTSYALGRKLGREFLIRHGERVKITQERVEQVEAFFARRGGTTILVGRFIGLVRALAPFVAGASRMPLAKFLPYDVLGAGAWAATFCVLGYVFWRSFDQLTQWVSRGAFAFAVLVALAVGLWFGVRLAREPPLRARTRRRIGRELERPALRPLTPYLRTAWRRAGRPALHAAAPPARFAWNRLTPGELGLEFTTLLALAAVGTFAYAMLAIELDAGELLPFDRASLDVADRLHTGVGEAAAAGLAALGSLRATAVAVGATILWAVARRRAPDAAALAAGFLATVVAAGIAEEWAERPPPPASLVAVEGFGFPSAHAARAVAWVACAVVLVRGGHGLATRFAAVAAAAALAIAIAVARVYLRAEYLSDALGGLAVGTAVFALTGTFALVVTFVRQNATPT